MAKKIEHIFENGVEMKACTKCKTLFPLSNFGKDKTKSDGLYMDSNGDIGSNHKYYRESHYKLAKAQRS